jgi:mRNA-degrading endonuclease RelE of RelBE toxin-antitoxin system
LAILSYRIQFTATAVKDLNALKASDRAKVEDAIEKFLRHEPDKISKSRIKRLRNMISLQYWLRVDDIRVFYDVVVKVDLKDGTVTILGIRKKSDVNDWLESSGVSDEASTTE